MPIRRAFEPVLQECHHCYCQQRLTVLSGTVSVRIADLAKKEQLLVGIGSVHSSSSSSSSSKYDQKQSSAKIELNTKTKLN
jgi:hypothetical protein